MSGHNILRKILSHAGDVTRCRMPAEWEPHAATWLAWPHYHGDWPVKLEPILWVCAEIIRNLAPYERVDLIVNDAAAERKVRKLLARANALSANIRFHRWPTNRFWLRDSGCIFATRHVETAHVRTAGLGCPPAMLARGSKEANKKTAGRNDREGHDFSSEPALSKRSAPKGADTRSRKTGALAPEVLQAINFRFNAWAYASATYSDYRHDNKLGALMSHATRSPEIRPLLNNTRVVLEGGSIDVNGQGTLLTTEECLLGKIRQRNPGMSRKDYEKIFAAYLGAPQVIWLGKGIVGDCTHGHVDDLARFVSPTTIVTMVENNPKDPNQKPLRDNLRRLRAATDQHGKPLTIVELPMPRPIKFGRRRLPATYANFYIANGVVLAPVFNDLNDRIALNTLAKLFPTRQVIPIYSGNLVWTLGTMHCMTQQQPAL
jgi:agmatine deiminase